MVSDNFVAGDNLYLSELRNLFFEVIGMMSVTHYGAIGDGITDNYGPLQIAIDDANRRHLSYIYVPYGRFRFRGELLHREGITFIGNPQAIIFNDKTGEEIPVEQFGVQWIENSTTLTEDISLIDGESLDLATGAYYTGEYSVSINYIKAINEGTTFYWNSETGELFYGYGEATYADGVWTVYNTSGGTTDYQALQNKPSINGVPLIGNKTSTDLHINGLASREDIITAILDTDYTTTTTGEEALTLTELGNVGGGFEVSNGSVVVVDEDIVLAKVNVGVLYETIGQDPGVEIILYRNSDAVINISSAEASAFEGIPTFLLSVEQNDVLTLKVKDLTEGSHNTISGDNQSVATYLTVEAAQYVEPQPQPYLRVHNIISDGNQIIDTGIAIQPKLKWEAHLAFTNSNPTSQLVFGCKKTDAWIRFGYTGNTSGTRKWRYEFGFSQSNEHEMKTDTSKDALRAYYDVGVGIGPSRYLEGWNSLTYHINTSKHSTDLGGTFESATTCYLFGSNQTESYNKAQIALEYSQIYADDQLVRDFVPVIRQADGEVGLYDNVTEQFFTNIGTGSFTYDYVIDGGV